jgi:predicted Na+-dependent transporter
MTLTAISNLAFNLWVIGFPPWLAYWFFRRRIHPQTAATLATVAAMFLVPSYVLDFIYDISDLSIGFVRYFSAGMDVLQIIVVVYFVWKSWRNWKGKKKAFKALGNKARAIRDKLLGNLRDNLQPRPVRVPL